MTATEARTTSRLARWGWGFLVAVSALLVLHGTMWFFEGPETSLASIAERTPLAPDEFRRGSPSASGVITLITRNFAIAEAAFGVLALLAAWTGYRHGAPWAWKATWVLVAAFTAVAISLLLIGGAGGVGLGALGVAAVVLIAQLLARGGVAA